MIESPYICWSDEGFTTTPEAYREFVRAARLRPLIATQIGRLRAGADIVAVGSFIRTAFSHVAGVRGLLAACKRCWSAAFKDPAIVYREMWGVDHLSIEPLVGFRPAVEPAPGPTDRQLLAVAAR